MAPIELYPKGKTQLCSISADGMISLPQRVLEQLDWSAGVELALSYIPQPLIVLLGRTPPHRPGFRLSYLSRSGNQPRGGKLTCRAFARQVLQTRIALPQNRLLPVYVHQPPYELALPLEEPAWQRVPFTASGLHTIPTGMSGVYEVLGGDERVLRIGQGLVADRLQVHLKDSRLSRLGQSVRYVLLDKPDAWLVEKVRLALHEETHGQLPPLNAIRA
jgi:hypothetical protein